MAAVVGGMVSIVAGWVIGLWIVKDPVLGVAGSIAGASLITAAWHPWTMYATYAVSMLLGHALDFVGFNAVRMLFYSAVLNGVLAPPLIVLVTLLTSNPKVMGKRVSPPLLRILGWGTAAIMAIAAIGMFLTL